ncbi:MAG: glycosyltransferase [Tepidisphaeraceae bacterium]|jgi:glycosyltransferase involved in cell wall biosynthesis
MTGISIAIATHNRAEDLARTLTSLGEMDLPAGLRAEILVIPNRCTDKTEQVIAHAAKSARLPLRSVPENRLGLSHARNRAISAAKYDVVAFLDDDVDMDKNWLTAMAAAHATGQYAAVGGRAHLVYPHQRPTWLDPRDEGYLTKVELGDAPRPAAPDEIYGLNLSFNRAWVNKVGAFRTDLGRVGASLIGDEEYELLSRITAAGGKLLYEPAAVVGHRVPQSRLNRSWFWRRCFHGNRGAARAMPEADAHPSALFWSIRRTLNAAARGAKLLGQPQSPAFFHETVLFTSSLGLSIGLLNRLLGHSTEPDHPRTRSEPLPTEETLTHTSA